VKHYRIRIDIDIEAGSRERAERRAACLYSDLERRPWIVEVLPNGIEERIPIRSPANRSKQKKPFRRLPDPKPQKGE
jgi:hypothetical protein